MNNNLVYDINDRPGFGKTLVFAFQQLLAILAATIAVPAIVGNGMSQSAALFGAGVGTIVYLLFTKFKSPVFLGSSFAFIGSMSAAFAGGVSMSAGYLGLLIGALFAGLVYTIIAIIVKFVGVDWIHKLMPPEVIGPTVAIIGLSLAGNAVGDVLTGAANVSGTYVMNLTGSLSLICALVTLLVVVICSVYGNKTIKSIPFIIGILASYIVATIFTVIGIGTGNSAMQLIDFSKFKSMQWYPDFAFIEAFKGNYDFGSGGFWGFLGTIAVAYIPVSLVIFSEHLSDHQNLSSIIGRDLLKEPGLHRTLLGDGVGSIVGAFFGGACNTTYGESVACIAITKNASISTIFTTAILAILISFFAPFITFLATIPGCVMGGVCITLYGFIAVSGLKMLQKVDLNDNSKLFTVSTILITGIGGMAIKFSQITITSIATALILGIIVNQILSRKPLKEKTEETTNYNENESEAQK